MGLERSSVTLEPDSQGWPRALDDLAAPPARIHVAGTLPRLERAIGIVGTRRATGGAHAFTKGLARALAREGCVIVSGGAAGIDAAAHEGALEGGGDTVAVLATGLDAPYPSVNRGLFADIAGKGAVVTEREEGAHVNRMSFLERNRIIAALSKVVVVVQAPSRSGALSTAAHARALSRPVLAVPWAVDDPWGAGCLDLLGSGAHLCRGVADVLRVAFDECPAAPTEQRKKAKLSLDDAQRALLRSLRAKPVHVDVLAQESGLPTERVHTALLGLLLMGAAEESGPGLWRVGRV